MGRYRVERVLGKGGMGIVVQAMHLELHQPVAIKLLLPAVLDNPQAVERFVREAQAAVRLKGEHVARVLDVGRLDTGAPYMVLEYLEGSDLARFPRSELAVGDIVDLMLQACEALAEAHSLGIVHRDIKPANLFITQRPGGTRLLKVLDFGISKLTTTNGKLTSSQTVVGTPVYMSPEQMHSPRTVDHRSDIWSLGATLYDLLQGAPPFRDDTFLSTALQVVNEPLPKLTVRLPDDLDDVIYRCLEKHPARRFQDVAELAQALSGYAASDTQAAISVQRTRAIVATSRAPTPAPAPGTPSAAEPGPVDEDRPSTLSGSATAGTVRLRARRPVVAGLTTVAAVVVIAVIASRGADRTERLLPSSSTPPMPAAALPLSRPVEPASPPPPPLAAPAPSSAPTAPASSPPPTAHNEAPATAPAAPPTPRTTGPARAATPRATTLKKAGATPKRAPLPAPADGAAARRPTPDDDVLGKRY